MTLTDVLVFPVVRWPLNWRLILIWFSCISIFWNLLKWLIVFITYQHKEKQISGHVNARWGGNAWLQRHMLNSYQLIPNEPHRLLFASNFTQRLFFYFKKLTFFRNWIRNGIKNLLLCFPENSDWSWIVCFQTRSLIRWNLVCAVTFCIMH